jgi:hypothetical protein
MKKIFTIQLLAFFALLFTSNQVFSQTTYKDVAPIFIANCTSCHNQNGLSFSLTHYSEIVSLAQIIKDEVQTNAMPPWPADPNYKHYVHERVVSAADKTLLIDWINNGTLAGDTSLAPPVPTYGAAQLNGTPDLILNLPTYTSTSSTQDKYVCLNVPVTIPQDRMIRAFEYIPGNPQIIHHAVITIDTTGNAVDDLSGNCTSFQGQVNIGDYAPGMIPTVFPNAIGAKFGMRLKAGSKMSFQLHVPKGTAGQTDNSQLRIYFYPIGETGVREMLFETALQNWSFGVGANAVANVKAYYPTSGTMPINISLYSAFPHSHNTCTSIINYLYKNTDTIPLVKIPSWDFHWQGQYTFPKMVKFPIGYRMLSEHVFDNTVNNVNTPNHNSPVFPGLNTEDEMLFDSYIYTLYQAGDENIDIESILSNEPLLNPTSVSNVLGNQSFLKVYPNPFDPFVYFDYTLSQSQFVSLHIYNAYGQEVKKVIAQVQASGKHQLVWDGNNEKNNRLPKGNYFYKLKVGKENATGKITLQ